jgi:hypothetical protein
MVLYNLNLSCPKNRLGQKFHLGYVVLDQKVCMEGDGRCLCVKKMILLYLFLLNLRFGFWRNFLLDLIAFFFFFILFFFFFYIYIYILFILLYIFFSFSFFLFVCFFFYFFKYLVIVYIL